MICLSIREQSLADILEVLSKVQMAEVRLDLSNLNRVETVTIFRSKKDLIATCRITELSIEECKKRIQWAILGSRTKKSIGKRYLDLEFDPPLITERN